MNYISACYNMHCNSIGITIFDGYILRVDCNKAEAGLKTTPWSLHVINALAIDNPLEYVRLYLNKEAEPMGKGLAEVTVKNGIGYHLAEDEVIIRI